MWFVWALSTALASSGADFFTKKYLSHLSSPEMALARALGPFVFLAPALFFIQIPPLDETFIKAVVVLLPLETTALLLYMKALRLSPLSLTVPFLSFTPAFMILTGALILNERLTPWGIAGILLIVSGSYLLNLGQIKNGLLAPFRAIWQEKGSLLMIIVAAIYAINSVLGKLAVLHSSPLFFAVFYFVLHGLFATFVLRILFRVRLRKIFSARRGFVSVGLSQSAMVICHMTAISLVEAAYMIAVKRLSLLFSVAFGGLFLKEESIGSRLLGAGLMVAGVALIVLMGRG
ncbi:EamA family transporter [Thermosulfuriphilus sp.]